jgi:hypothetical protein
MRLRAPVPDDAPAVLAVLVAREMANLSMGDDTLGDPRALKVYERAGMRVSFRYDVYECPMAPSAGAL